MKKISVIIIAISCLFLFNSNVYATDDIIQVEESITNNILTINISSNQEIYGLKANLSYDDNTLEFKNCTTTDNLNFYINNEIILVESYTPFKDSILKCNFNILTKEDTTINLTNISISKDLKFNQLSTISNKITLSNKSSIEVSTNKDTTEIKNPQTGSKWLIVIIIILVVSILTIIISKSKIKKITIFLIMMIFPLTANALTGDINSDNKITTDDIKLIVDYLLNIDNTKVNIDNSDLDKDNNITINDLVLAEIEAQKPQITYTSEKTTGTEKYYTSATRIITLESISDITSIKYCITTSNECTPSTKVESINNNISINLSSNKEEQLICVTATNKDNYQNTTCDTKKYLVDETKIGISIKSSTIKIDSDTQYNAKDNIIVNYGVSSGTVTCSSTNNLKIGNNTIKCIATGNNGTTAETSYIINKSTTYNKTAVFFGDSITYGYSSNGYSWANYIGDNYDLKSSKNNGKSGYRISSNINEKWITKVLKEEKGTNYDFVILHGGCNDVYDQVSEGTYSETDFSGNYDTKTFLGGLEDYLYNATIQWPNARIGYIINYQTPNNANRSYEKSAPYYTKMKKVLEKWHIQYLDLYFGSSNGKSYNDILKVETTDYLVDNLHLNAEGYKVISPYIYNWMQSINKYSTIKPY